jgi:hypothetical protein
VQIFDELRKVGRRHDLSAGLLIGGKDVKEEQERVHGEWAGAAAGWSVFFSGSAAARRVCPVAQQESVCPATQRAQSLLCVSQLTWSIA